VIGRRAVQSGPSIEHYVNTRVVIITVHRRLARGRVTWSITTNQRDRLLRVAPRNRRRSFLLRSLAIAARWKPLPVDTMTSQDGGIERDSAKHSYPVELRPFNGQNCCEQLKSVISCDPHGFSHASVETSPDPASGCSVNSTSCTPHSIDDILSRPRRGHVTSLVLPVSRRSAGPVECCWSSENVSQRLGQSYDEQGLTSWKARYWTQQSPAAAIGTPNKRGMIMLHRIIIIAQKMPYIAIQMSHIVWSGLSVCLSRLQKRLNRSKCRLEDQTIVWAQKSCLN